MSHLCLAFADGIRPEWQESSWDRSGLQRLPKNSVPDMTTPWHSSTMTSLYPASGSSWMGSWQNMWSICGLKVPGAPRRVMLWQDSKIATQNLKAIYSCPGPYYGRGAHTKYPMGLFPRTFQLWCFSFVLRSGELLALKNSHIYMTGPKAPAVISLGMTKGGKRMGASESVIL